MGREMQIFGWVEPLIIGEAVLGGIGLIFILSGMVLTVQALRGKF